jgi:hypothetical protein
MKSPAERGVRSVSILIEWENVIPAADDHCLALLRQVGEQIHEVDAEIECLVLFNPHQVQPGLTRSAGHLRRSQIAPLLPVRLVKSHNHASVRLSRCHE